MFVTMWLTDTSVAVIWSLVISQGILVGTWSSNFFFFVVVMCDLARWKLAKTQKKDHGGRWRPPSSHEGCGASRPAPRHTTDSPHIALRAYVVKTKKILFLLLIIAILVAARCQKVLPVRHQMWWRFGQSRASMAAAVAHIHSIWSP